MDPVSITVSVVALLELTKKVANYAKQVKDASADRDRVFKEASSLTGLLILLKDDVEDRDGDAQDPWLQATSRLTTADGPLHQYKLALEMVVAKVMPSHGHHKFKQAVTWRFSKEEVTSLLLQMERVKSLIHIALEIDHTKLTRAIRTDLQEIRDDLVDLKISSSVTMDNIAVIKNHTTAQQDGAAAQHNRALLEWICPTDYHAQHADYVRRRQIGTGEWFLQDSRFQDWMRSEESTLFCPGMPGAGKTMMATLVIDRLLRSENGAERPIAFIYCNYKQQSKQSIEHMLSSLLRQVVDIQEEIPQILQDVYATCVAKRSRPSEWEFEQILSAVTKGLLGLTVVVDALDECEAHICEGLLSIVGDLRKQCKVRLLATSRNLPEIRSYTTFLGKPILEVRASDQDLEKYIRSRVGEFRSRRRIASNPDLLETLVFGIVSASGGMFLLAQLFVDSFKGKFSMEDVKATLRTLPTGCDAYDAAYGAAMERISTQDKDASQTAKKVLSWILRARRPLTTSELLHTLAVEVGVTNFNEDRILDSEQLLTICVGLVTIDTQTDNVRFIHYTTQEYLERNQETWLPQANIEVARTCTAYLSLQDLSTGPCSSRQEYDGRVETLRLLDYAAVHWGSHMSVLVEADYASELGGELEKEAVALLSNVKCLSSASQVLFMSGIVGINQNKVAERGAGFSGSHWIGRFGLTLLFRRWASTEPQWDCCDFDGRTPLSWAASEGHETISKLLLKTGKVDVDLKNYYGQTPLSWASRTGRETTVKLLLEKKANVNSKDNYDGTPSHWATQGGHEAVLRMLLSTNMVEADSGDDLGKTPLFWAVHRKNEALVKLLLNTGQTNAECRCKDSLITPVMWAAMHGNETIFKLLLDSGTIDTEAKDVFNQDLLCLAIRSGQGAIAELLLDTTNPDVTCKDIFGRTSFSYASETGQGALVQKLLDTGRVDIDVKDDSGKTPFLYAAIRGQEVVLRLLLDSGKVDIDLKDDSGKTPLSWAAEKGQEIVLQVLLGTGKVDVDSRDKSGQTPLVSAARGGHEGIAKLLCDTGKVNVDSRDEDYQTPLFAACFWGREGIVKLLLDTGEVDADLRDKDGLTPLLIATERGHEGIVKLLLDTGEVDVNSRDEDGWTSLLNACGRGDECIVKLLLASVTSEVDVNVKVEDGLTALLHATKRGHDGIVKLVLDTGKVEEIPASR